MPSSFLACVAKKIKYVQLMSNLATSDSTSHERLVQDASVSIQAIASSAKCLATDDAIELPELLEGILTDNQIAEILNIVHTKVDAKSMDCNSKKKQEHQFLDCYVPKQFGLCDVVVNARPL